LSSVLLTAGTELYLIAFFLIGLHQPVTGIWQAVALPGGVSLALLGLGALALGPIAVEGTSSFGAPAGTLAAYSGNGPETLASAAAGLVSGTCRFLVVAGQAGLAWLLLCESLSWWGGDQTHWVRWGLDGQVVPDSEPGFYQVASVIAGGWFLILVGLVLAYPISFVLGWGVNCYLRARQQTQEIPPGQMDLSDDEQRAVRTAREKRKKVLSGAGPPAEQQAESASRSPTDEVSRAA
jgi:hypothetical protein